MQLCVSALTVWQKTTSRRYCSDRSMAIVGALSCISRKTMDFLAVSLIMATHSVSVVRRGYNASLHSPGKHKYRQKVKLYRALESNHSSTPDVT